MKYKFDLTANLIIGSILLLINLFIVAFALGLLLSIYFGTNFIVLSKEFGIWILFVGLIIMFVNNILNKKENKNETKRRNN